MTSDLVAEIVESLKASRKYRSVYEPTLERVAKWALERHCNRRVAEKAAKRKLHQACGAYMSPSQAAKAEKMLRALPPTATIDELRQACLEILKCHTSTLERLDYIERLYADIEELVGRPRSVLDLAAGLNAFTIPWAPLLANATYKCIDIDCRSMVLSNLLLERLGRNCSAICGDVLVAMPTDRVDLVIILKSLPCLERQESGAARRILKEIRARYCVVSFPAFSLGGRDRGMTANYEEFLRDSIDCSWRIIADLSYSTETVYVLTSEPGA
ncbi:MAG: hypothetical protein JW941_00255 [Candidatus Coatesbacteria bacterium]|nr:hypothetical protein [Candidatus Coatesbacteria bacterium]